MESAQKRERERRQRQHRQDKEDRRKDRLAQKLLRLPTPDSEHSAADPAGLVVPRETLPAGE